MQPFVAHTARSVTFSGLCVDLRKTTEAIEMPFWETMANSR